MELPSDFQSFLTFTFSASPLAIVLTFIIAISLPLLLHAWMYRTRAPTSLPSFLLIGPSGSGKTTLLTLFERGAPAPTHTSQAPLTAECSLPVDAVAASTRYRSANDPTNQIHKKFFLVDTPGHGKLRHHATTGIVRPQNLKGVLFVVDASALADDGGASKSEESSGLREAAQYLHDILRVLQRRYTKATTSKGPAELPVLVVANKADLFTAMPQAMVKGALEAEIGLLRDSRSKGLIDSGIGLDDQDDEERDVLGGNGEGKFQFELMEEYNVPIEICGAAVNGRESSEVDDIWGWVSRQL